MDSRLIAFDNVHHPLLDRLFFRRFHPLKPKLSAFPASAPAVLVILPAGIWRQIIQLTAANDRPQLPRLDQVSRPPRRERITVPQTFRIDELLSL